MTTLTTLGFIGFGNMGQAIANGLVRAKLVAPSQIKFTRRNQEKGHGIAHETGYQFTSFDGIFETCNPIILAVKPQQAALLFEHCLKTVKDKTLISVLAGVSCSRLRHAFDESNSITRAMPNTPCLIGKGMTGLAFDNTVSELEKTQIRDIFRCVGQIEEVSEEQLDCVTGISGSGPAFVYAICDYVAKIGARHGLDYDTARRLFSQTLIGAGAMCQETEQPLTALIDAVRSPNGTTHAGLCALENSTLFETLDAIFSAAIQRSKELR